METSPTTKTTATKTCECGCGATVARRFLPGHDARLKGRLLREARSAAWQTRELAVNTLVERGWGHFLPADVLGNTPVRSRNGRKHVETRHVMSVMVWVNDEAGESHSHSACPAVVGKVTRSAKAAGWACSTCVHTHELAEVVAAQQAGVLALVTQADAEGLGALV